jgi:hypothetical protein
MQQNTLFGHLATLFASHPENIATEAFHYILSSSTIAKRAFLNYLAQAGIDFPPTLMFQTQMVGADNAIPDLVGRDVEQRQRVLVEAKFWAGLTANQPVTYLRRLPADEPGILLFLIPGMRFTTLWPELARRCNDRGINLGQPATLSSEFITADVLGHHQLAIASWRSVLAYMLRALETEGHSATVSDVQQLQGLCNRMDNHAFLPLRSEELTANTGQRINQYCHLIDDITEMLVANNLASVKGLRSSGGFAWYGRYLRLHGVICLLQFSANLWANYRSTPLWLRVYGTEWTYSPASREALARLEIEDPPRLIVINNEELEIPLFMPTEEERDAVITTLYNQVTEIAQLLKPFGMAE